jgi:MFS family permease
LIASFGWRSIFYVNIPIGILGFLLGKKYLSANKLAQDEKFDVWGAVLFAIGMVTFLLVLNEGHDWGWLSSKTIFGVTFTLVTLLLFWHCENKVAQPMLDLTLFKHWPFLAGNLSGLLSFMAMFCNLILLPFYLHSILNLSAKQIGLIMTASPIVMAIVAPVSGFLSERVSATLLTATGLVITAGGLLYHATFDQYTTIAQVAIGQAIMGLGNGMFQSPNNNSVMSSVAVQKLGIAGGINALVRNVGMGSGIAISVTVFDNLRRAYLEPIALPNDIQLASAFLTAYHGALIVAASLAGLGAVISSLRRAHAKINAEK